MTRLDLTVYSTYADALDAANQLAREIDHQVHIRQREDKFYVLQSRGQYMACGRIVGTARPR